MTAGADQQAICAACRTRDCCSHFDVEVTFHDLSRIARALELQPSAFCDRRRVDAGDDGFALDPDSAERHTLVLRRVPDGDDAAACVFLVTLPSGRRLCGLGPLAPLSCQRFPVVDAPPSGPPSLYAGPGCWRTWTADEVDLASARAQQQQHETERTAHDAALARWNTVLSEGGHRQLFETFLASMLDAAAAVADRGTP